MANSGDHRASAVAAAHRQAQARAGQTEQAGREAIITIRTTPQERTTLEMVAAIQGQTLSAFIRSSAIDVAAAIIAGAGGMEKFAEHFGRIQAERAAKMIDIATSPKDS